MLAFNIEKTTGREYEHIYIKIFYGRELYRGRQYWDRVAEITFQADDHNPGWYGMRINYTGNYQEDFSQFIKFCKKIESADMYNSSGEGFVEWVANLRGMKRIVTDKRLNNWVTVEELEETKNLKGFKVFYNGKWDDTFLAWDERDLAKKVAKEWSNYPAKLEYWFINGKQSEEIYALLPNVQTIDEILETSF